MRNPETSVRGLGSELEQSLREEVVAHGLKLTPSGLSQGTSGNLSVRHGEGFLITPSGQPYDKLLPADIVPVNMDGRSEHRLRPSSEWRFHRDIYVARADVHAIVHAHPLTAPPWRCADWRYLPCTT